ncbi:hypothetical protein [Pectobacterium parmentieri]|uniref:hypothetical protein n=1 Tax=Pectobacterium parmentieri TaxID=1905730 RepID=UPI000473A922|nr:hypothetical protein [Pectobacterium parmentieri]PWD67087.1 hypothetical protein DF211_04970 [Pectobacterium parmentieri]
MRRKILSAVTLLAFVPISSGREKYTYEQIKPSVIEFLKKGAGSPAGCDLFKDFLTKDPLNNGKRKMMVGFCDSDIDFSKQVSFSEMYTHQFEGHSYVCGVISGKTKLDRKIGVRFISAEPYHLVLNVKYSRRPIAYVSDDSFLIDSYRSQLESFNELNSKYCK